MSEKIYKNSYLIQGNYSYNYLCNLCLMSISCLDEIQKRENGYTKDKNLRKCFSNLQAYLLAAYRLFGKLSEELNEEKIIISDILYEKIKADNSNVEVSDVGIVDVENEINNMEKIKNGGQNE